MGICNVLAVIPFLCSAPAEAPQDPEEQVIESAPSPDVEMGTLIAPDGGVYEPEPEYAPAPSVRHVSEYEVLPPSAEPTVTYAPQTASAAGSGEANSFSDWVNRNWGEDADSASQGE
jgi:hypothetical protein